MILLSLNLRGTGGTLKLASVRSVLEKTRPEIVLFQETLVHADKARAFMHSLRPNWFSCVVNSVGNSGGLMVSWDPNFFDLVLFLTCGGILLSGICLATRRQFSILNVYGPCVERKTFWECLGSSGLLAQKSLILAGDFNLTLSSGEIWGGARSSGSLEGYFKTFFQSNRLIDIAPGKLVPTWRNSRAGTEYIAKRLDRTLISEDLLDSVGIYRSWVEYPFISDHAPIILQLELLPSFKTFPFKLNPLWILGSKLH
jgi:exonuclease III